MLPRMVEIDNLNSAGEMLLGEVPNPGSAIAENDFRFRSVPASIAGFPINAAPKWLRRFDRCGVGGGALVSYGPAVVIRSSLCEDASQLDLAGVRRLSGSLALTALGFSFHNRNACTIHFYVHDREILRRRFRKI